ARVLDISLDVRKRKSRNLQARKKLSQTRTISGGEDERSKAPRQPRPFTDRCLLRGTLAAHPLVLSRYWWKPSTSSLPSDMPSNWSSALLPAPQQPAREDAGRETQAIA